MLQVACMLSVLLFTACSSQGDEPDSPQPTMADNVQVGLRISLGSTDAMIKATPAGDYDSALLLLTKTISTSPATTIACCSSTPATIRNKCYKLRRMLCAANK